jgi:hypothetical protein
MHQRYLRKLSFSMVVRFAEVPHGTTVLFTAGSQLGS